MLGTIFTTEVLVRVQFPDKGCVYHYCTFSLDATFLQNSEHKTTCGLGDVLTFKGGSASYMLI